MLFKGQKPDGFSAVSSHFSKIIFEKELFRQFQRFVLSACSPAWTLPGSEKTRSQSVTCPADLRGECRPDREKCLTAKRAARREALLLMCCQFSPMGTLFMGFHVETSPFRTTASGAVNGRSGLVGFSSQTII